MHNLAKVMRRLRYFVSDTIQSEYRLERPTEEMLQRFESELGYTLPPDYRDFLNEYAGVSLSDHVVAPSLDPRADSDDLFSVSDFFGFYSAGSKGSCSYDLFHNYHTLQDTLPPGMVPFAESGENRFCISCDPQDFGRVYCLVPADFADDEDVLYLMANSFTEFMESLRVLDD